MAEKNYITPDGYKRLVDELTELAVVERPRVVREVSDAAAEGDRSENAAYIYGKRRLREIDRRLGFLKRRLEFIQVVKADESRTDRVFFGAWVEVEDEEGETHVYQIVGVDEVEAEKGRISWKSPIGHALIGKQIDDSFVVKWHAGQRELTIVDIRYRRHGDADGDGEAEATGAAPASRPAKSGPSSAEAEPADAGDDEPFESDEDAERAAQFRARQTAKKKPAKAAPKARAPKAKAAETTVGAKAKSPAKGKAPDVAAKGKAAGKPAASASRMASIKAAADGKAAKKP